ncbi:MAG TPA: hypothetical protein VFM19_10750 [Candidatus Limnocylindria bacterium]|nr:hypothetical protein [Candidatus Limnocylindria bacterium]
MQPRSILTLLVTAYAVDVLPTLFGGRRKRGIVHHGRELREYRSHLVERTTRIDGVLADVADAIEGLRRRDLDVDDALVRLASAEDELDAAAEEFREMLAPEELHPLHVEYDANLERALRGIVTAERGCGITKLPHRPPEDEEPFTYWKRGAANVMHARMRMQELAAVLADWEPGRAAEASVAARLHRDET